MTEYTKYTVPIKYGEEIIGSISMDLSLFEKYKEGLMEFSLAYIKNKDNKITPGHFSIGHKLILPEKLTPGAKNE